MITILCGPNTYRLNQENKKLVNEFVEKYGGLGLEQFEADEIEEAKIVDALESIPFLSALKLVVIRNLSANKVLSEKLEKLVEKISDATDLIIIEPKPDKRTAYYKKLQKIGDFREFKDLDKFELTHWAVEFVKSNGGILTSNDASYLVERVGTNQYRLANELLKLINYEPKIDREAINLLTTETPQSTIFNLLDAALTGNIKKALKLYDEQRKQKAEPQKILGMIAWQLHILAISKTMGDTNEQETATVAGINPYVLQKTKIIARRLSLDQLKKMIKRASKLDISTKSRSIDSDDAIKNYLLKLANSLQ